LKKSSSPFRGFTAKAVLLSGAWLGLMGCTTYVQESPRRVVYQEPPPPAPAVVYVAPRPEPRPQPQPAVVVSASMPGVEIRAESDFYEPLAAHGRWEVVGSYGRCWIPGRVEVGWRPYCNGHWRHTDAGWYWATEEPWGWATYHYGRWDLSPQFGWYWVPQTQWAPAWVSWHEGGGYVGWAPLHPTVRVSVGVSVNVNVAVISPRAFVFVQPQHFLQPVRPSTVVVNNTTIINKTVNITKTKIVNNTVINEGPQTTVIEQASGKKLQSANVKELRHKDESPVMARRFAPGKPDKQVAAPDRPIEANEKKAVTEAPRTASEVRSTAQAAPERRVKEIEQKIEPAYTKTVSEPAIKPASPHDARAKAVEVKTPAANSKENKGNEKKNAKDKDKDKSGKDADGKVRGKKPQPAPPEVIDPATLPKN
jgi:hypothetical protein